MDGKESGGKAIIFLQSPLTIRTTSQAHQPAAAFHLSFYGYGKSTFSFKFNFNFTRFPLLSLSPPFILNGNRDENFENQEMGYHITLELI